MGAAIAELSSLVVLHFDKDFDLIAEITGSPSSGWSSATTRRSHVNGSSAGVGQRFLQHLPPVVSSDGRGRTRAEKLCCVDRGRELAGQTTFWRPRQDSNLRRTV